MTQGTPHTPVQAAASARPPALDVRGLTCGYGSTPVLEDVGFSVAAGQVVVLLGPNGVGKTTLFRTVLGFLAPLQGSASVCGHDISALSRRDLATLVAYVPQGHDAAFGFTAREMVLMGRTPALDAFSSPKAADDAIACAVIDRLGLAELAERDCTTLSGGQLQLVLIARALAQQPRLLIMDEPCASLDLGNQVRVLECVRELAASGLAVVVTSHDPNHALMLDAGVVCIARSGIVAHGPARSVLTPELLRGLYGVDVGLGTLHGADGRAQDACVALMHPVDGQGA